MKDYRFDVLAYGMRKDNVSYPMSRQASEDLKNNHLLEESSEELWDDIWRDLHTEYER